MTEKYPTVKSSETQRLTELEMTAYHEAGHAVVSYALGAKFDYVTIEPEVSNLGHVMSTRNAGESTVLGTGSGSFKAMKDVEAAITSCLGGTIGQIVGGFKVARYEGKSDRLEACKMADRICKTNAEAQACLKWLYRRAWFILTDEEYSCCLEHLAQALIKDKHLTYRQAIKVFKQAEGYMQKIRKEATT